MQENNSIILHDYYETADGGGRLALILAQAIEADLAYGFKVPNHPYFLGDFAIGKEYSLDSYSGIQGWRQFKLAKKFSNKTSFLADYDLAVYSGFYAPLAVQNHLSGKNVFYCNTPPRFIYDQRDFYLSQIPFWQRPLLIGLINYLQPRYEAAVQKMDVVISNSKNVQARVKHFLNLDTEVVYPPCEIEKYRNIGQEDFYLSTARLDPLKRVDLVVQAFVSMPEKKLVVISEGPEIAKIKRLANGAENIEILGRVSEEKLVDLMGCCIATIYIPREEDFGLSPVESMAAGKPVIGVAQGGLLETIEDGITGILMQPDPGLDEIVQSVEQLTSEAALGMRSGCEERAKLFRQEVFEEKMRGILNF
jgi:glycosyltransferase involved in cell wall biosynthesis